MASRAVYEETPVAVEPISGPWLTAAELAELGLPGLPADKRALNRRIAEERWLVRCDRAGNALARKRQGRGGGFEYHISLLPAAARVALARMDIGAERTNHEAMSAAAGSWRWFEAQTDKVKDEARRRLDVVRTVEMMCDSGMSRSSAVAEACIHHDVRGSTLWTWLKLIKGHVPSDWLPALAPQRKGGGRQAEIDPEIWTIFKSDYLRLEQPTLATCYERTAEISAARGLQMPSERTLRRRIKQEIDPNVQRLRREGKEAVRRSLPAQRRSVDHLRAMECVNIDGHTFDVWCLSRDGVQIRPILIGIQDIRSSKILAWRLCESESAHHVRLVFGDLFTDWGIPDHCVLDNGRAFASKWISGGTKTRFRFKVKDEDPVGLLVGLGIQEHWALPYHGQSKPIERAWLDMTDRISRHPFCAGAYTGPNPMKKPENSGSRLIPWHDFAAHVDREIGKHNAKLGRRGRDYRGRSFDQVFAESYSASAIKRATPEQLHMALLAGEQKLADKLTGEINLFGNRYYSDACSQLQGQRVTVRFDPDDLTKDVHLYDLEGRYLCAAQSWNDVRYLSHEDAKKTAKFVADKMKEVRKGVEAENLLHAHQVAALQVAAPEPEKPVPGAVRIVRHRGQTAAALKHTEAVPQRAVESRVSSVFDRLNDRLKLVE